MPAGVSAFTALANTTLGSNTASITFSSISGSYRDLFIVIQGSTTNPQNVRIRFNSDATGSNYTWNSIAGLGSGSGSAATTATNYLNFQSYFDTSQGNLVAHIMDYSATDKHKTYLSRQSTVSVGIEALAGRWFNTAAVTSVMLIADTNFATGTSFALYGVSS
jgi:hypothetical protein